MFKDNGLNITVEANVKSVNFLDVTLNLDTCIFCPYMKPNETPLHLHNQSNHPPGILRNIPQSVTGLTSNTFKDRFYGHRSTFHNENHPNHTTLSNQIWFKGKRDKIWNHIGEQGTSTRHPAGVDFVSKRNFTLYSNQMALHWMTGLNFSQHADTDAEKLWPTFIGIFSFRSPNS